MAEIIKQDRELNIPVDKADFTLYCEKCERAEQCPYFEQGGLCFVDRALNVEHPNDLKEYLLLMLEFDLKRVFRTMWFENQDGKMNKSVSLEMLRLTKMIEQISNSFGGAPSGKAKAAMKVLQKYFKTKG